MFELSSTAAKQRRFSWLIRAARPAISGVLGTLLLLTVSGCGDGSTTEIIRFGDGSVKQRKQLRRGLDGQLVADGPYTIYFPNGQRREEGNHFQGEKHGTVRLYFENGQLQGEAQFEQGQQIGDWARWDEQGNPLPPVAP